MNVRLAALASAALAAAVLAAPAGAAGVCLQIIDATGDGMSQRQLPDNQPGLDIVSADVATGRKNLVAAVRLKGAASDATTRPAYYFDFTAGGVSYVLGYVVDAAGATRATIASGGVTTEVDAVYDPSSYTVTWTVARKQVAALKKPGGKLTGLGARSSRAFALAVPGGRYEFTTPNDEALTGRSYVDGTTTCLKGT